MKNKNKCIENFEDQDYRSKKKPRIKMRGGSNNKYLSFLDEYEDDKHFRKQLNKLF